MDKLYYTPKEVREKIFGNKLSNSTIMNLIHEGKIESVQFNRKYFIPKKAVDKLTSMATDVCKDR